MHVWKPRRIKRRNTRAEKSNNPCLNKIKKDILRNNGILYIEKDAQKRYNVNKPYEWREKNDRDDNQQFSFGKNHVYH